MSYTVPTYTRILLAIGAMVALGLFAISVFYARGFPPATDVQCANNLELIAESILAAAGLVEVRSLRDIPELRYAFQCPCSSSDYEYRLFPGQRRTREALESGMEDRIIVWCPSPCHDGMRYVLHETGLIEKMSEEKLSTKITQLP